LEYELPQLVIAVGAAAGVVRPDGLRINLLAEEVEAAEARRRDPVRRVGMVGGLVLGVGLAYTGWLFYQWLTVRRSVGELRARHAALETSFRQDQSRYLADGRNVAVLDGLRKHASERILFGDVLNAMQFVAVEGIRFQRLILTRTVEVVKVKPAENSLVKPPDEHWERFVVQVMLRNYGTHRNYEAWRDAVMASPFFKERLRENEPVVISAKGEQQVDPLDPDRSYTLYVIDCHFRSRRIEP